MFNALKYIPVRLRISMGLVGLMTGTILLASAAGFVPNAQKELLRGRAKLCESLAISGTALASSGDRDGLKLMMESIVNRDDQVISIGMRRESGDLMAWSGPHESSWDASSMNSAVQMTVPIFRYGKTYGHLEVVFLSPGGFLGLNYWAPAWLLVVLVPACLVQFSVFLRKTLNSLDPSAAVPQHVRGALDTLTVGLMLIDARGRILFSNRLLADSLGLDPYEVVGTRASVIEWIRDDDSEALPWQECAESGEMVTGRVLHYRDPIRNLTFSVNCTPILEQGYMVTFEDITTLEENKVELAKARDDAERANQSKSVFLANMSHEIRTPMNAILGFTEVLRRNIERDETKRRSHLNTIHSSGTHLLNLINDILDLSKIEADRLEVESIRCGIHQVIADVVTVMRVRAEEKDISLDFIFETAIPETITSDPARLRQILTNLIGNAIKFTESGGVRIVTRFDETGPNQKIIMHVVDTGIGMSDEAAAKIFDPFSQADASVTRRFGGTGLGLSISKRFAEALGGNIAVTSEQGVGSVFTVTIDAGDLHNANLIHPTVEDLASETTDEENLAICLPDLRVLVVDDGQENRDLMCVVLEEAGTIFETAENGLEAIQKANASHWDVILMDVQMPVMDGNTATRKLRSQGYKKPIFALTAHAMKTAVQECMEAGFDGVLTKPIDFDHLITTLAKIAGTEVSIEKPNTLIAPSSKTKNHIPDSQEPITSTLPTNKERFRSIVAQFVDRLDDRFDTIESAVSESNYEELIELGHSLKGASGNCGFGLIANSAVDLEEAGRNRDASRGFEVLAELRHLRGRITVPEPSEPTSPAI
ncbi:MAG: response regulator [Rubripirellula sp.]